MATLKSNLSAIAAAAPAAASRALLQTGADIADLTKQLTPVDTGALKQSYGSLPISSQEVQVGSGLEYSVYQEYGTSNMAAQPHLTPAFMQSKATFEARMAEEMKRIT